MFIRRKIEGEMRLATQKELLERIRDELAEKYSFSITGNKNKSKEDWNIEAAFNSGFDKGAEEMAKLKDEEWEKRVAELVTALSIYALTNESFPEYNDLALKALENFRKEVK